MNMSDVITDSAGIDGPISEAPKPRKRSAASTSTRATKKAAQEAPVEIKNVEVTSQEDSSTDKDGQKIITTPKKERAPRGSNSFTKENGAISSGAADVSLQNKQNTETDSSDLQNVALWSEKSIRWGGLGSLTRGYNIVTKEAADVWLTRKGIRVANPDEVASYYSA